ncbi:MAG: hypothetical protein IAF94_14540 [Pirellulaceae bacterium]|nr:hypothetical protein [Pirellulaceae bacterium]
MMDAMRKLASRADDLAHQIRSVVEQSKDTDVQRLTDDLLVVLDAMKEQRAPRMPNPPPKSRSREQKKAPPQEPNPNTIRLTLTLNAATIGLIEYLRSSKVDDPLYGCIDICDEDLDWLAAARFASAAPILQPPA